MPATVLLVAFTARSLVLAAVHVYFRDVRYLVQAALLVWISVTPIIYQQFLLGRRSWLLDLNPLTGIVDLFRLGTIGFAPGWERPVLVPVGATLALAAALEVYGRHYRDTTGMLVYVTSPIGTSGLADLDATISLAGEVLSDYPDVALSSPALPRSRRARMGIAARRTRNGSIGAR
ncbi:MAG: hypothetical protein ACR2LQ_07920 [Acidimicrobiales bacterium]